MDQEPITHKEKNMLKAARMRHIEDMSNPEIADELGLTVSTIENYFSSSEMQQFNRHFSDVHKKKLMVDIGSEINDTTEASLDLIGRAISSEDVKPRIFLKAAKQRRETLKDRVRLLKQVGLIDEDSEDVEQTRTDGVEESLSEVYSEYMNSKKQEEEEQEVETSA